MPGPRTKPPTFFAGRSEGREFNRSMTPQPEPIIRSGGSKLFRILIVDDERPLRRTISRALERDGYELNEAPDGLAGLEAFRNGDFDLVINDRQMPNMGGLQMIREIRKLSPDVKILVLSGGLSKGEAAAFRSEGVLAIIDKPFDMYKLKETVRNALCGSLAANGNERKKALKVVFVDDDPDVILALADAGPAFGFDSKALTDPFEALEACRSGDFDVLVSDFHMPGMDGLELLKKVKTLHPDARVVICSAEAGRQEREELYKAGASAVLMKPVVLDDLADAIEKAAAGAKA